MPLTAKLQLKSLLTHMQAKITGLHSEELPMTTQIGLSELLGLCTKMAGLVELFPVEGASPLPQASAPVISSDATQTPVAGPVPPAAVAVAARQRTVLVIDDDRDIHKVLGFLLKKRGSYQVISETDPTKAWHDLSCEPPVHKPDIILMDLMMPQMTGFELLARLRAVPRLQQIKVIIGSSRSYDKDRIAVLQAGANDFIAKPFNFDELLLRLNNASS